MCVLYCIKMLFIFYHFWSSGTSVCLQSFLVYRVVMRSVSMSMCMIFYFSMVTMCMSCIIFKILPVIGLALQIFHSPGCLWVSLWSDHGQNCLLTQYVIVAAFDFVVTFLFVIRKL